MLVVDDFAIQYTGHEHANHLLTLLKNNCEAITVDWQAQLYIGITIHWDYTQRTATLSMPGYIDKLLAKHKHPTPSRPCFAPYPHNPPSYGATQQLVPLPDDSPPLDAAGILRIQQIVGALLYYSRAVDCTLAVALSALASEQAKATENTNQKITQLLNFCATNPVAKIRYQASEMCLVIHSDAGYGNETKFRSRAGGHYYLGNATKADIANGAILNPTGILRHVASSAMEAEIGALFVNAKEGIIIRNILHEMGFPQQQTTMYTDNTMAHSFIFDTIKKQRSRAIDMRFHWIQDQQDQG